MLKGQDVLILLRLLSAPGDSTVRSIGDSLDLDPAGVHRGLKRLEEAGLVNGERRRVNRANAEEFLLHGLKYVFPAQEKGLTRGVPTAWAAEPLRDELAPTDEPPPVWPDARGRVRGVAVSPLHENVPALARRDPRLWEQLALLDAIRLGDGRVRSLASKRLSETLRPAAKAPA